MTSKICRSLAPLVLHRAFLSSVGAFFLVTAVGFPSTASAEILYADLAFTQNDDYTLSTNCLSCQAPFPPLGNTAEFIVQNNAIISADFFGLVSGGGMVLQDASGYMLSWNWGSQIGVGGATATVDLSLAGKITSWNFGFFLQIGCCSSDSADFSDTLNIVSVDYLDLYDNPDGFAFYVTDTWTAPPGSWSGYTKVTPLPASLPLFATGLGALGLLGWRRKRKAAVAAATSAALVPYMQNA